MNVLRAGYVLGVTASQSSNSFWEDARLHQKTYGIIYYLYVRVRVAREDGCLLALLDLVEQRFGRVIWVERAAEGGVVCKQCHRVGLAIRRLELIEHVHD